MPAGVTGPPADAPINSPVGKIKHIVIIIQENRTFDNIFHGFSEPSGAKADYAEYGCDDNGKQLALQSIPFENLASWNNSHDNFVQSYDNGKLDGLYAANASTQYANALLPRDVRADVSVAPRLRCGLHDVRWFAGPSRSRRTRSTVN